MLLGRIGFVGGRLEISDRLVDRSDRNNDGWLVLGLLSECCQCMVLLCQSVYERACVGGWVQK